MQPKGRMHGTQGEQAWWARRGGPRAAWHAYVLHWGRHLERVAPERTCVHAQPSFPPASFPSASQSSPTRTPPPPDRTTCPPPLAWLLLSINIAVRSHPLADVTAGTSSACKRPSGNPCCLRPLVQPHSCASRCHSTQQNHDRAVDKQNRFPVFQPPHGTAEPAPAEPATLGTPHISFAMAPVVLSGARGHLVTWCRQQGYVDSGTALLLVRCL
jgi:hypothetical protein